MLIRTNEIGPNWDVWRSLLILDKRLAESLEHEEEEGELATAQEAQVTTEVSQVAVAGDDVIAQDHDALDAAQPEAPDPAPQEDQRVYILIVQEQELQVLERSIDKRIKDSDDRDQKKALIKAFRRDEGRRQLASLDPDWREHLEQLALDFPNFESYIEYLKAMCVLAAVGNGVPQVDPVVLNGPPGIGKTFLAERIAAIFGAGMVRLSMENEQCNGTLVGNADFWSNAKPGRVLGALSDGEFANPLFFLDELDKVNGSLHYNPLSPLVLSTSWVRAVGFSESKKRLPIALQQRVTGATWHSKMIRRVNEWESLTRYQQIINHVARHKLENWIAIDDDDIGWPDVSYDRLVKCDESRGLADPATQEDLAKKLAML